MTPDKMYNFTTWSGYYNNPVWYRLAEKQKRHVSHWKSEDDSEWVDAFGYCRALFFFPGCDMAHVLKAGRVYVCHVLIDDT